MIRRRAASALLLSLLAPPLLSLAVPAPAHAAPPEVRTESSTAVTAPDGTSSVTLYAGPVRMPRGAAWQPIDLTLTAGPDGVVRPVAVPHDLALTPTGPAVRFAGGGSAALAWTGTLPAPQLDGHRATYPQALPGHDLVVQATRTGFAAALRRTDPAAAPVPPLTLRRETPEGAPVAPDPEPVAPAGPLVETGSDTGSAGSRVVAAAPPATDLPVPFDTTVQSSVLRTDLSGDPDLRLGTFDGTTVARSLLTWDLTPLAGRPVESARLVVHQDWSASCAARGWEVWSAPPAAPASRWADQPVAAHRAAASTETRGHAACAPGWTAVDVTELVRGWVTTGAGAGSVQLRASDESDPLGWKRLGSADGPHVPHLEVRTG